jgi:cytochrome P450
MLLSARFTEACRRRHGDVVTFSRLLGPPFVMVFDPDLVKQTFHAPPEQLLGGAANTSLRPVVGEHSLLLADGAEHMDQRRLLLPSFTGERLLSYEALMRDAADRTIDSWPVGEPFPLLPSLSSLTLDVITRAVFGVDEPSRQEKLKQHVGVMIDPALTSMGALVRALFGGRLGNAVGGQRFERRRRTVDELIYETIAPRRAAPDLKERDDVLSRLLLIHDERSEAILDAQLRDELLTLLVAGYKSTQLALAWAFELLLRNPDVLERLRRELAAGDESYLNALVRETLRLRPVAVGVSRMVGEEPYELDGYLIPPGTEINISILDLHRRADRFPEPDAFRPERFLGRGTDISSWVPFGAGARRCLGASFASVEIGVVIRRVLERTQLVPVGREPEKPVRKGMTFRNAVTFLPKRGVRVMQARPPESK